MVTGEAVRASVPPFPFQESDLIRSLVPAALLLGACLATAAPVLGRQAQAPRQESVRLAAFFKASDEAALRRSPLEALQRGDARYAAQFPRLFSPEYDQASRANIESELAALRAIDRSRLSREEQISYDVFKWQREINLKAVQADLLPLTALRPISHNGIHTSFPQFSSGDGAAPFATLADYENNLKRIDGFVAALDRSILRMREGMAAGITNPKLLMANAADQLDLLIGEGVEGSTFYRPVTRFPPAIGAPDQARLKVAYAETVRAKLIPAFTRLRDFIRNDYMPVAREGVGLSHMKGGDRLYAHLIERHTTTRMPAAEIHRLGLAEVKRLQADLQQVKREIGFTGSDKELFDHIRTDPKFKVDDKQELIDGYYRIGRVVDANLPKLFRTIPKARLEVRPVPPLTEKGAAGGSYEAGTLDGKRPGIFFFNSYDLPSRTTPGMETLYLHEGAPGHHFQIMLARENESLPAFQRFGGNTAFVEGWALYAQDLGPALGVYKDPYQRFGYLDSELFRAVRLVIDTGIHAKGWTRDQAIQYMLDNTSRGRSNTIAEVERYIAGPGQALAYKIGQLKIRGLKTRAEKALGPRFDIRAFHEQVLMSGALPLTVLEAKIDRWIAETKRA
jgi:uncharacterized protein (DUF885 family)